MFVGYMRVSSDSDRQNTSLQRDALADTARLYRLDALDLGARQPVWTVRPRHERPTGVAVIKMAAGDTTACSTPS